jgi:short-subunit dehydrogenase
LPDIGGGAGAGGSRKVAVVTGASSGIGAATARALARRGWLIVGLARREDRLRDLAEETGGEHEVCDVGDRAAVDRAAAAVLGRHPAIHLLVNNAGMPARRRFLDADAGPIEESLRVNYLGSVWCLRAFLPGLEAAAPSDVVNVVSVAGTVAFPAGGPYAATKHAQLAFSRSVAAELRGRGVRVHTLLPGFVETEGFPQRGRMKSPLLERLVVDPEDIASAILRSVDRDRSEAFVPRIYRGVALLQTLAPGLLARMLARRESRRPPRS